MVARNQAGVALLILGIAVLVLSLAADAVGLGSSPGLGRTQILGALAGVLLVLVGALRLRRKPE